MKTPPMLVGAALLFWGGETGFLVVSAVLAVVLEGSRFIKLRWELSDDDFSRIWTFCTLLFLASAVFAFTESNGPANVHDMFAGHGFSPQTTAGSVSGRTAVLLVRWLPLVFFLFIAAQAFSSREGIHLETISWFIRRRRKKMKQSARPVPISRPVNVAYPYFIGCLFAASTNPRPTGNDVFFFSLCGLCAWALWPLRARRFGFAVWAVTIGAAMLMAYGGEHGLLQLQRVLAQYNPAWLSELLDQGFDPMESRTQIGQVGRIKTSNRIVLRLETTIDAEPPHYLREATYRVYKSSVWYSGSAKDDFIGVSEQPINSGSFMLLYDATNSRAVNIACYLPGGKGLLPLPTDAGRMEHLPAYLVQKNAMGTVRAEGPGLVLFDALYGSGNSIDAPPDTNEDFQIPDKEKAAVAQTISELHLEGASRAKARETISRYFATKFGYSLWQREPKGWGTNASALSWFLLESHRGHCEYFASATVLLLRQIHIPARYTVGYSVHEQSGRKYIVRANDAHAWCRVWNAERKRWEDFDTTPGTWFEMERQQRSRFQFLADWWSNAMFEFSKFRWGQSRFREYLPWGLVPVLALLLYQIIFRTGRRRAREKSKVGSYANAWPGLDSEFYLLERELARRGCVRRSGETLSDWLQRAVNEPGVSEISEHLRETLRLHYRYRFDPEGLSAEHRERLRREVAACMEVMLGKN